jgi:transcriptional regulator with XRE-family HTH domain
VEAERLTHANWGIRATGPGGAQEELAEAASLSPRSVSDLERGVHRTAHRDTAGLLADALGLTEPVRALFVAAARGRGPAPKVLAARQGQAAPGAFQAAATRTLPRDIAAFTGRQAELAQLMETLASMTASGGVVGIHAIGGMAGVGKTTFAVHAAHRLAGNFPDGQLFLPLHGHTPGRPPVDPGDALASLLLTAGVPAAQIPPGVEARMALWRGWLAGRQLLLVLDDAVGTEQVLPLLPGAQGSLVLSGLRRRCPGWRRPGHRPPGPGGAVRPLPAYRAGPRPVPAARPDPRPLPLPRRSA